MQDFIAGDVVKLLVSLVVGGQPSIPDQGSVKYTLRDHSGAAIEGMVEIPVETGPAAFQFTIEIPAEHNTLAPGKRFERRLVHLTYTQSGVARGQRLQYRLIPFLNYSVTPNEVRSFLGVNASELPDEDINLLDAYFAVEAQVGQNALEDYLSSGTTSELAANTMIRMRAVLDLIPSLKQRIAQQESSGQKAFTRPAIRDFDALRQEAEKRYQSALDSFSTGIEVSLALVVATQDIDPITAGG